MIELPAPPAPASADSVAASPTEMFIAARRELQREVALGRRMLKSYAAQVTLIWARMRELLADTRAAPVPSPDGRLIARQLVATADSLEMAAHDWMDLHVRPVIDRHRTLQPPPEAAPAVSEAWGESFYRRVRVDYAAASRSLDVIDDANDRIHAARDAIEKRLLQGQARDMAPAASESDPLRSSASR